MTKQKKNKPIVITDKELGNILTQTLANMTATEPQPAKELSTTGKTALMVVMLASPEGATIKDMAEKLGWKENSVRGAMSTLAGKQVGATLISEKKDGIRRYYLVSITENENTPEEMIEAIN